MNNKHFAHAFFASLLLIPTLIISAEHVGEGGGARGFNNGQGHYNNSDYLRNMDNDRDANLNNYGYGGFGGYYGEYIDPYPPEGAEPGMTDDSGALYESYMQSNNDAKYNSFER